MPKPIERSRYELETGKSQLAKDGGREVDSTPKDSSEEEEASTAEDRGREMDSTPKEPSEEEEASTAESETEAIAFNEDIYILTGKKGK